MNLGYAHRSVRRGFEAGNWRLGAAKLAVIKDDHGVMYPQVKEEWATGEFTTAVGLWVCFSVSEIFLFFGELELSGALVARLRARKILEKKRKNSGVCRKNKNKK